MISEFNSAVAQVEVEQIELETPKQSFRTSAFRNTRRAQEEAPQRLDRDDLFAVNKSEKNFASALVADKISSVPKDELEHRLAQLMKSPAIAAILQASRTLAETTNCSENDATLAIIQSLRELNQIWDQLLVREGLQKLSNS